MESGIPPHLLRTRTLPARLRPGFRATGQAVVPRFDATVTELSVAYLGLQQPPGQAPDAMLPAQQWLLSLLEDEAGPQHHDRSRFLDTSGHSHILFACYWTGPGFERWWQRLGHRWTRDTTQFQDLGRFAEVFVPSVDRVEAITDGLALHGLGRLAGRTSAAVIEQGYWGAMRDRLPIAQTDAMNPGGSFARHTQGRLTVLEPPSNLCVIRTGQDWSQALPAEQAAYLTRIEPSMKASSDLLSSQGARFGCLAHRYAWMIDADGRSTNTTFGLSIWRSLSQLELWAESHFTHLDSYVGALQHGERHGAAGRFSRYHEVLVPDATQARFEYLNCHAATGVMATAGP